jgi:hypothetical protein
LRRLPASRRFSSLMAYCTAHPDGSVTGPPGTHVTCSGLQLVLHVLVVVVVVLLLVAPPPWCWGFVGPRPPTPPQMPPLPTCVGPGTGH